MKNDMVIAFSSVAMGFGLLLCVAIQWYTPAQTDASLQVFSEASPEHSSRQWQSSEAQALQQERLDKLQQDLTKVRMDLERNTQTLQILGEFTAEAALSTETINQTSLPIPALETEETLPDSEQHPEQPYLAFQSRLDRQLSQEDYDMHWAPEMSEAITQTLQQESFQGSELTDLACQTSLCRIAVQHQSTEAEMEFLHQFIAASGFTEAEAFYSREEHSNGRVEMRYYISRNGQRLPMLAQME